MRTRFLTALPLAFLCALTASLPAHAWQTPAAEQIEGHVVDAKGAPIADAQVLDTGGRALATTAADGGFEVPAATRVINVEASHFAPATVTIVTGTPLRVVLERPLETVVVTAYRSPLATGDSPASTRVLDTEKLQQAAAISLDGKLRETPGFELFRRSSSLVANPTTEGVSLRGLGSTAVSRSLVVFDDVPVNDPYGGWIHWEELPELGIQSVELVRGGASDLYGSSAIGGVISIEPARPQTASLHVLSSYGGLETTDDSVLGSAVHGRWSGMASAGAIATDGYTLIAPNLRGPVDVNSNVHEHNGLAEIDRKFGENDRFFVRGNVLDETRHNGTPLTGNGTRLWRYATGADWNNLVVRLYGDDEHYWQTFSSVATGRVSEKLTRYAEDPADELGAALHWHQPVGTHVLILAGADTHDVRASDNELLFSGAGGTLSTTARQRQTGVYGEALLTPEKWTISASGRVDHFSNFDAYQYSSSAATVTEPAFSETVFDPRVGVTRRLTQWLALNASGFRAYRAPTENELYRTGQVGQQTTLPNSNLRSERATGWETGFQTDMRKLGSSVRVSYFWTRVNRPVTALTLSTTPTATTLKRENLGRIESRGVSLDYAAQPARWIAIEGGYQYADATVTQYAQEPQLVGNWIPQVARNMATAQVRLTHPRLGLLSLQERASGHQFDDDANQYVLHGYFSTDAYASHDFGEHVTLFASGENLFDRAVQVGKTPVLTLGTPRVARFGLRLNFGGE
ncbi:TonB-dependent receptor [Paracidobacterium acidisoli]|nr:TonB-dependent receptor [Paracidobacterium acidisoli]MBT9332234.1 TonB-dependent receptor [Paracidobacterium acidisoli]